MHKHTHAANLVLYNAVTIFVQLIHQRLHCLIAHVNAAGPEAPNDLVHGQAAITVLVELEKQIREAKLQGGMEWLGWSEPDPQRIHVKAMQQAVRAVSTDTDTPLEKIRVWVDYVSIPQKNLR